MKDIIKKSSAFLLSAVLSLELVSAAYADAVSFNENNKELATKDTDLSMQSLERLPITKESIPDIIDFEQIKENGAVARLKSQETSLSEIVLENKDGSRSLYLFDTDVKFINEKGDVLDKSNHVKKISLNQCEYFTSESNDIEVKLPSSLASPLSVSDSELNISMRPLSLDDNSISSAGLQVNDESVRYDNVYDEYTDIEYTFTYDGVKEEIILEKFNGKNEFEFEISTNGLTLYENKGTLLLADEKNNVKATLGEVTVFSADNKNNTVGEFLITEKEKNNLYTITIVVDEDYLTSSETIYPVIIDPTIKSTSSGCGIQDMQVFQGADGKGNETSEGLSGISRIGWTNWGACRLLMKFNGLNFSSHGITSASQIQSAYVEMRDLMCEDGSLPVGCYQFTGNTWSESDNRTWNNLNAGSSGTMYGSVVNISYANGKPANASNPTSDTLEFWHKWDITSAVKAWTTNTTYLNKGLIFKTAAPFLESSSSYSSYMKTLSSVQGNSKYKPYFCINYVETNTNSPDQTGLKLNTAYWIRKKGSNNFLTASGWKEKSQIGVRNVPFDISTNYAIAGIQDEMAYWKVEYDSANDAYRIVSLYSPELYLSNVSGTADGTGVTLNSYSESKSSYFLWRIKKNGTSNSINNYVITSKSCNYTKGLHYEQNYVDIFSNSNVNIWEFIEVRCPASIDSTKKVYADNHALEKKKVNTKFFRYECLICGETFKSPEEQDYDILTNEQYISIVALQRAYIEHLAAKQDKVAESFLRIMNNIRKQYGNQNGKSRYAFSSQSGVFSGNYRYLYGATNDFYVEINVDDIKATENAKPFQNFIVATSATLLSSVAPAELAVLYAGLSAFYDYITSGFSGSVGGTALLSFLVSCIALHSSGTLYYIVDSIDNINAAWTSASALQQVSGTPTSKFNNMYRINIKSYGKTSHSEFSGTYYFNAKSEIKVQNEKFSNYNSGNVNADKLYGRYSYSPRSNEKLKDSYWMSISTGNFLPGVE